MNTEQDNQAIPLESAVKIAKQMTDKLSDKILIPVVIRDLLAAIYGVSTDKIKEMMRDD